MKRKLTTILWIVGVLAVGFFAAKRICDYIAFRDLKTYDRSHPLNIKMISSSNRTNYIREEFSFEGCPGEEVPVLALIPAGNRIRKNCCDQISDANWSKRIMRELAPSPLLLKSSDTMSIPRTSGALDPWQVDAFPFWSDIPQPGFWTDPIRVAFTPTCESACRKSERKVTMSNDRYKYPAIILLYGIGMKMNFADRDDVANAVTKAGFALFVPEQYGRGRRKKESVNRLQEVLALRHRIVLTIKETRRLIDAISMRPDIDPNRIYFWGASFGAMTGCSVMAYDQRLPAGIFTLAAGDFQKMAADSPYRSKLDKKYSWMKVVAPAVASFLRPFDPIYHIAQISPRPLLFQNASNDELIPKSAVDVLYKTAGEPKKMLWYDSPHDHLERAVIEKVVGDALGWLKNRDNEITSRYGSAE